jgi:Mrp family chromosome partitioning ATPase
MSNVVNLEAIAALPSEQGGGDEEPRRNLIIERALPVQEWGNLPPLTWQVRKLIPDQSIGVFYGPPGCGKSFMTLHLANCIATGTEFLGERVKQGKVLYVYAEGERGLPLRQEAWQSRYGTPPPDSIRKLGVLDIRDPETLRDIREACELWGITMVVIDTLSANTPGMGDEDNANLSTLVTELKRWIIEPTGAGVALVHHTPLKAPDRLRGGTALLGNVDWTALVKQEELELVKQRDGSSGLKWAYKSELVLLEDYPADEDGMKQSSRVISVADPKVSETKALRTQWCMDWLREQYPEHVPGGLTRQGWADGMAKAGRSGKVPWTAKDASTYVRWLNDGPLRPEVKGELLEVTGSRQGGDVLRPRW